MSSDEINPRMISVINLDSSVTNSDLYDLFKTAGEVIWCEVCKHIHSGFSLGYGYVSYSNPEHAKRAITELNSTVLKGNTIYVSPCTFSFNQLSVLVEPDDDEVVDEDDLRRPFEQFGVVTQTSFYMHEPVECYFYVYFEDHQAAAKAATALRNDQIPGMFLQHKKIVDPHVPHVRSQPRREVPEDMQTFQGINVCVTNLASTVTDWYLRSLFCPYGTVTSCKATPHPSAKHLGHYCKETGYGRVSFSTMEEAKRAIAALNDKEILQYRIKVALEEEEYGGKRSSSQMSHVDEIEQDHADKKARVDDAIDNSLLNLA